MKKERRGERAEGREEKGDTGERGEGGDLPKWVIGVNMTSGDVEEVTAETDIRLSSFRVNHDAEISTIITY